MFYLNKKKGVSSSKTSSGQPTKIQSSASSATNTNKNNKGQSFIPVTSANSGNKPPPPPLPNTGNKNQKKVVMVALYDYDPQYLSPNADLDVNNYLNFQYKIVEFVCFNLKNVSIFKRLSFHLKRAI